MKNCNRFRRIFSASALFAAAAFATFAGCTTTADYTLGEELAPGNQQMVVRHRLYSGGVISESDMEDTPCKIFETRLYKTDSILSSTLGTLYLGLQKDERFGMRKLAFASQFVFQTGVVDTVGFGYRPVYDSAAFIFSVDTFAGDTMKPLKYNVYALTGDLVNEKSEDSTFYISYDPREEGQLTADAKPIFTFEFPDPDNGIYTTSTSVRMKETPETKAFVDRIWCINSEDSDWDGMATHNVEAYSTDSAFVHNFKGLYIEPADDYPSGDGSVFAFDPSSTGFELFGRNRSNGPDPDIMADTIDRKYVFTLSSATRGNVSANSVKIDYSLSDIAHIAMDEDDDNRPQVELGYIDGCGGVVTELKFTDEFLASLRNIHSGDTDYTAAAINQASLTVYFEKSDYDYTKIDPIQMAETYEKSLPRLGMYTDYKSFTPVADYLYTQEQSSSVTLAYNGYINRSQGCYIMNISSYMQSIVNAVLALEPDDEGKIDYSEVKSTKIYLAPSAYDVYTFNRSVVQGGDYTINPASIKLELTYTLVK